MRAWHPIAAIVAVLVLFGLFTNAWDRPPLQSTQQGYRGLGMVQITNLRRYLDKPSVDKLPDPIPTVPAGGPMATEQYKNLKVLTDVSSAELLRVMTAITAWVAPKEGCAYCHEGADFASDAKYTKTVARHMIEMVRHINSEWKSHVDGAGVTCYICHRGNPVPMNIWFTDPGPRETAGAAETGIGKNHPTAVAAYTSLPYDPFSAFLGEKGEIRVIGATALPEGNRHSIKQTEWTYALMLNMSRSLGVNCTFCHNTRSFFDWDQSTPKRVIAWHGIRMVRDLNMTYLDQVKSLLPADRLSSNGAGPRVNCATCHQGAHKPLLGANLVETFPELQGGGTATPAEPQPAPQPQPQ
jgi:photosynthetic reaction center cytochrome c subunit